MIYVISTLFGLAIGSFANVCIFRLPDGKSVRVPRSHCPHCGQQLKAWQNIPLISFFALRARCFYCHTAISWQYPLIEGVMGLFFFVHAYLFRHSVQRMAVADTLAFYLMTISIIDYRRRIIPDELSLSLLALGLFTSWANPYMAGTSRLKFAESLGSLLAGGLLMLGLAWLGEKAFKKEALGGGDVKLVAATASVLGWQGILGPLLLGSIAGGLVALALLALRKKRLGETLPFGPFLSLGAYVVCLFPNFLPALLKPEIIPLNFP